MKYSELCKLLKKNGCSVHHEGKNHTMWQAPNGNRFTVPRHKTQEVPKGTLKSIFKDAGLE